MLIVYVHSGKILLEIDKSGPGGLLGVTIT
jgi:hypothetical protein